MEDNAFVCWVEHDEPWELEQTLLKTHSCPLNIQENGGHAFHGQRGSFAMKPMKLPDGWKSLATKRQVGDEEIAARLLAVKTHQSSV